MRLFRSKAPVPPQPVTTFDHLVSGITLLNDAEAEIENTITNLHNAIACFEASGHALPATVNRAESLIMALRKVQANH